MIYDENYVDPRPEAPRLNPFEGSTTCIIDGIEQSCGSIGSQGMVQCPDNTCAGYSINANEGEGGFVIFAANAAGFAGYMPNDARWRSDDGWIGTRGTGVDNRRGTVERNHASKLPQKSTCADFVDKMLNIVQGPAGIGVTQTTAGRLLARWADKALAPQARNNNNVVPSGFKAKYVAGGQNLFASVHIAGVAGGTLIGDNPLNPTPFGQQTGLGGSRTGSEMVKAQFTEDNGQLQLGLARQKMGFTTTGIGGKPIPGYDPKRPLADFIA